MKGWRKVRVGALRMRGGTAARSGAARVTRGWAWGPGGYELPRAAVTSCRALQRLNAKLGDGMLGLQTEL